MVRIECEDIFQTETQTVQVGGINAQDTKLLVSVWRINLRMKQ